MITTIATVIVITLIAIVFGSITITVMNMTDTFGALTKTLCNILYIVVAAFGFQMLTKIYPVDPMFLILFGVQSTVFCVSFMYNNY